MNQITFNIWKHHRKCILYKTEELAAKSNGQSSLKTVLSHIGSSVTDMYLGELHPDQIVTEILEYVRINHLNNPEAYYYWLKGNNNYRIIPLSDRSLWTLRLGHEESKYIHIHPARYSPHSIRMKTITLKSIIATYYGCMKNNKTATLSEVNKARIELLNESPIKDANNQLGFGKMYQLFTGKDLSI
jgi:hypothetical protein